MEAVVEQAGPGRGRRMMEWRRAVYTAFHGTTVHCMFRPVDRPKEF